MRNRPKPPNCCGDPNNAIAKPLSDETKAKVLRGLEDAKEGRVGPYLKPEGYFKRLLKAICNVRTR